MDCPSCGHMDVYGGLACGHRGGSLALARAICATGGAPDTGGRSICGTCASALSGAGVISGAPAAGAIPLRPAERDRRGFGHAPETSLPPAQLDGERKQVSVMFVDVVGSMDIERALDPERWRVLLDRFLLITSTVVQRFGGTIDKFTGDGIMAVFGAPLGHEDHARRGCLAALALHEDLHPFSQKLAAVGITFAVRVGLNSGEVIVGAIGEEDQRRYAATGYTVGVAKRMEALAPEGSTAVSAATAALVAGEFDLRDLGEFEVKGSGASQRVLELRGTTSVGDRVAAADARGGLSPFVGRERERQTLAAALERANAGKGQVIALVGEPGVGKSRLAYEFARHCAGKGIGVRCVRALSHGSGIPFLPVLELARSTLGVGESDEPAVARERIERSLATLDPSFAEDLPLVFDFLGVGDPERPAPKIDPEARRRQLLSVLRRFVHARTRVRAAVTIIEDLHWLDEASTAFLAELIGAMANTRTLIILTYRREYTGELLQGSHCQQLALGPLAQGSAAELLASLLGADSSLDGLSEMIASLAAGNPFFSEELVAALAQSGQLGGTRGAYRLTRTLGEIVLPATVQATLAARIDRLPRSQKELLEVASVMGYELSEPLLREISGLPDGQLSAALEALVSSGLLTARRGPAGVEYAFEHPLVREVAYRSPLSERRRQVHRRTALAIERAYPERLDELAALIAQHWEAAGEALAAARFYARAAGWLGYSDVARGIAHWRRVGELVNALPDSPETTALALVVHVHELRSGWRLEVSERDADAHYRAGREIAERSGDLLNLLLITLGYGLVRGLSGHVRQYGELCEEANRLSLKIGDPAVRIATTLSPIYARFLLGRLPQALALTEGGIALGAQNPTLGEQLALPSRYAFHLTFRGMLLAFSGQLDASASALEQGLQAAGEQEDLETEGWGYGIPALLARYGREAETALVHATHSHQIAERTGSAFSRVWALGCLGYAHRVLAHPDESIAAFWRALEFAHKAQTGLDAEAFWLAGLSEALLAADDRSRALEVAQQAVALARQRGSKVFLPTCYRALAEALLASDQPGCAAAREALQRAEAAARRTGAHAEIPLIARAGQGLALVGR